MIGRIRRERKVLDDVVHPDAERAIEERAVHGRTDVNLDGGGRVEFRSALLPDGPASRTSTHTLAPRDRYRSSGIELGINFEPRVEETLAVAGVDVVVVGAEASVAKRETSWDQPTGYRRQDCLEDDYLAASATYSVSQ